MKDQSVEEIKYGHKVKTADGSFEKERYIFDP